MRPLLVPLFAALILAACSGPKPEVRSADVAPAVQGKATVTVVVENRGGGDGQVEVKLTLRDRTGRTVAREERTVELKGREVVTLVVELEVPEGAEGLGVEAEAVYPPD